MVGPNAARHQQQQHPIDTGVVSGPEFHFAVFQHVEQRVQLASRRKIVSGDIEFGC
jgi:hypothetical protein